MRVAIMISVLACCAGAYAMTWNVTDHGAVGDGGADCTAIFQRLLDQAGDAGGGTVVVPTGHFRIEGTLSIPGGVRLEGTYRLPPTNRHEGHVRMHGSVLQAFAGRGQPDGPAFITLAGNSSSVRGLIIHYPEWSEHDLPPVPYPPCIQGVALNDMAVIDCLLLNPYEGMRFVGSGKHLVRNVYGYPIRRGYYADRCYDVCRVENVHFWTFGLNWSIDHPYGDWINQHGVAFEFARSDWHYVHNTFCFGYGIGYHFTSSESGACNGNFLGLGADCCTRCIVVDAAHTTGLQITNAQLVGRWDGDNCVGLEIAPGEHARVGLLNCTFSGRLDRAVWQRGDGLLTLSACSFLRWDNAARNHPAIQLDAGSAILTGNDFRQNKTAIRIGPRVQRALLNANLATPGLIVDNRAGDAVTMSGNAAHELTWTDEARAAYRVDVGSPGDWDYLRYWHAQEPAFEWGGEGTRRWSAPRAELRLPVLPNTAYTLALEVFVNPHGWDERTGVYLDQRMVAALPSNATTVARVDIPPQPAAEVTVTLRAKGFRPREVYGNKDYRTLGMTVRSIEMRARGVDGDRWFDANRGVWRTP